MKNAKWHAPTVLGCLMMAAGAAQPQESPPRAARSVHLWWSAPEGEMFYNEMTVEASTPGSYFMACGWNTGYFGIQELGRGGKVVLFSVWDPTKGDDPNAVKTEERVEVLHEDEGVKVSRFGGEGTGGKSMFSYPWEIGEKCRFLVRVVVDGEKTAYAGYFYLNQENRWKHLVTFRTRTGGQPLKGYYSFVEDFRRDGKSPRELRRSRFGLGWVKSLKGEWIALTEATFTADRTPLMNINAGMEGNDIYLATGGETTNALPLKSKLRRLPGGLVLPSGLPE